MHLLLVKAHFTANSKVRVLYVRHAYVERLSLFFNVTLLHEKVNFHLCLTYKICVIG